MKQPNPVVKPVGFLSLENFEQLLNTYNYLDEEGKKKAMKSMGSIYEVKSEE